MKIFSLKKNDMKKNQLLLLGAFVLFGITSLKAQEEVNYLEKKNEINVQVDNIFSGSDFYSLFYYNDEGLANYVNFQSNKPAIGVGYKYHSSIGAFRVKISFGTYVQNFAKEEDDDDVNKFALHQENFSAGYEFHSNIGRTQIFYGIDGTLGLQFAISTTTDNSYEVSHERTDKTATIAYGIKPFLGFKYFISPKFSVSSEYHLRMERSVGKNTYNVDEENERVTKSSTFYTKFGPMGQLTFSFHF